jgi:hypothetical protein
MATPLFSQMTEAQIAYMLSKIPMKPFSPRSIEAGLEHDPFPRPFPNTCRYAFNVEVQAVLTPYLIGWRGYFGFCQTPRVLTNLEAWIRRRLRSYLWQQWRTGHNRFKELRRRGVPKFNAAVAAGSPTGGWRMSGHPAVQQALRNRHFDDLGLPRLYLSAEG